MALRHVTYGVQPTPWFGPQESDYYGKMSYHWDGPNPIPTSSKLKAYLDPIGTGEEFMDGSYVQMDEEGNVSCNVTLVMCRSDPSRRAVRGWTERLTNPEGHNARDVAIRV